MLAKGKLKSLQRSCKYKLKEISLDRTEMQTEDSPEYQVIIGSTWERLPADVLLGNNVSHQVGDGKN